MNVEDARFKDNRKGFREITQGRRWVSSRSGVNLLFMASLNVFRGPFLESPGNFSGPKSDFQIEIQRIRARVLANKLLLFVSLTDSFIMLNAKLLKPLSCMQTTTALRAR